MAAMRSGTKVYYVEQPDLYGTGEVEAVLPNGMLLVTFPDEARPALFGAHELAPVVELDEAKAA